VALLFNAILGGFPQMIHAVALDVGDRHDHQAEGANYTTPRD
jgi:hypothetical protein